MASGKRNRDLTRRFIPDDWLARRAVAGGRLAMLAVRVLLIRYSEVAFHLAGSFRFQHADASNVVQEASLKVLLAIHGKKYDPDMGTFPSWFLAIVKHECLALQRQRKKCITGCDAREAAGYSPVEQAEDPRPTPVESAKADDQFEMVSKALGGLSHEERFIVEMRLHYRWTFHKCAEYLDSNPSKVYQLYKGALKNLRRQVEAAELRACSSKEIRESSRARQRALDELTQRLLHWQAPQGDSPRLRRSIAILRKTAREIDLKSRKPVRIGRLHSVSRPHLYQHAVDLQWKMIECARQQVLRIQREPTNIEHHLHLKDLVAAMRPLIKELETLDIRDERQKNYLRLLRAADG